MNTPFGKADHEIIFSTTCNREGDHKTFEVDVMSAPEVTFNLRYNDNIWKERSRPDPDSCNI